MRTYDYDILNVIKERWSPRSFSNEAVPEKLLMTLIEAARYAPSCFNEQPWRFIIGQGEHLEKFQKTLMPKNQIWANKAPILLLVACETTFSHNGKINKYAEYDCGTAWGYLALEATKQGLYTHAMAGFDKKMAKESLGLLETVEPIAMVAIGYPGDKTNLDDMFKDMEKPNTRKRIDELIIEVKE